MPEAGGGARLNELEARWRTDRSPRVFLQLADELRRAGANERAVRVLQEGLTHHPDSVSGRVALGRLQLEQGDAPTAADTLERALARDPAQMVASKLLIEARIRMGDATRARERLDLYRILQERDHEIDGFERRIAAMERSERHAALETARASQQEPAPTTDGSGRETPDTEPSSPLFDFGGPKPLPPLDLTNSLAGEPAATNEPNRSTPAASLGFDAKMPFGAIHDPVASAARITDFLRGEALFVLPAAEVVAPASGRIDAVAAADELSAFALAAAAPAEAPEPIDLEAREAVTAAWIESAAEVAEPAEAPIAFEQFSTLHFAEEVERDTLVEPLADVLAEAGAEALVPPVHELAPEAFSGGTREAEREAAPDAVPFAAGAPSATLARLYLDQGHLAEAEAEFRRVLAERPDDNAASAGLKDVGRRRAADETVSGWAGDGALSSPRPLRAVGLTQRKIQTLRDYLERVRRGRPRAHVS